MLTEINKERILSKYAESWTLSDFKQIAYTSENGLFTCLSTRHGACVLKVHNSVKEVENEYHTLQAYQHTPFCKVYETDLPNGVLLLEQIIPGTRLRVVPDLDKRLALFCEVFKDLHRKPADERTYPTYLEWVTGITAYMQGHKHYEKLTHQMIKAAQICRLLCEKYTGKFLLHGDLHHDNILLGENNRYRIIDPKGVMGDRVFDIPRFILNEFDEVLNHDFGEKFKYITYIFSKTLAIPEQDIRCLVYIEMCMAQCWHVEEGQAPNIDHVLFVEKMMRKEHVQCVN